MKKRLVKKIICYKQPNPCLLAHEQTPYNAHQWRSARTVMQRMVRLADQGDRWFRGPHKRGGTVASLARGADHRRLTEAGKARGADVAAKVEAFKAEGPRQ